ncbi:MAG: FAD-dependent oxidoreductase [Candidatus Gracilibacteria bacterium]|nr:FAD-dependent oxidoreductase [Candidatus Gracilibacteria bacterium]
MQDFDVIVIGSGSGGLTVSIGLASAGKKVALIEKGLIGGDCTNFGCVPSKAFIDLAKNNPEGLGIKQVLEKARARRKIIRDEETPEKIENYGMKVFKGFASFKDKNTILISSPFFKGSPGNVMEGEVLMNEITAKNIVISTGSHANNLEIDGVNNDDILTNENVFELQEDIKDLVVIGGGYIGCELAESFANCGVKTTIIQRNEYLIPREEKESSILLKDIFLNKNINVLTKTDIIKSTDGYLIVRDEKGEHKIKYDKILVALGRGANIDKLGLENAGINFSKGGIKVDKYNRTNIKNIFAIGDCVENNPMFTHWANNEGRGVVRNIILPFLKTSTRNAVLPATLYTNIEVARIGKTEQELLEIYSNEDIVSKIIYFDKNDRSILTDNKTGFIKINFKRLSGTILGATIVSSNAGEMLPVLSSAMQNNISAYKLSKIIFSYPTKAELIKKIADSFVIETLSNIKGDIKYLIKSHILQMITGIIWISILFSYFYFKNKYKLTNIDIAKSLYDFFTTSMYGPIIYILVYAIRPLVFFPATFLSFMSGAIFGIWGGLLYTIVGENLSANFSYTIGKIFGKRLLPEGSTGLLAELKSKTAKDSFVPILLTRLLFFPFDVVNYLSGILKVERKGFFFGTLIGTIPGSLVFILAGSSVENVGEFDFSQIHINFDLVIMSVIIFVLSLLLAKILRKKGV